LTSIKNRIRSEHNYQANLKAEIEVRHLNEMVDSLAHRLIVLLETKENQMEMLEDVMERLGNRADDK
jgi:uncharacterized membrane protein